MYQLLCPLGHTLEIGPEHFGQRLACPMCQAVVHASPPRMGEPPLAKYEVQCGKGHILRVKQKYLGKEIRCPSCQLLVSMKPALLLTSNGQPLGLTAPEPPRNKPKEKKKEPPPERFLSPAAELPNSRIPPPPQLPELDTDDEMPMKPDIIEEDEPRMVPLAPDPLPPAPPPLAPPSPTPPSPAPATIYDDDFEFEVVDTQFNLELAESGMTPASRPKREVKRKKLPSAPIPDTVKVPQGPVYQGPAKPAPEAPTGLQSLSSSEQMKVHFAASSNTVQFPCPHGHLLELDIQHRGAQVQCPTCQLVFEWNY